MGDNSAETNFNCSNYQRFGTQFKEFISVSTIHRSPMVNLSIKINKNILYIIHTQTSKLRITTPKKKYSIQQIHHISDELSIIRIRLGQSITGFQIQEFFFHFFK